jgi:hypothetical protein
VHHVADAFLAVAPAALRAAVVVAGGPAALVDLRTLRIDYAPVAPRSSAPTAFAERGRTTAAGWLGRDTVATVRRIYEPFGGVRLLDVRRGRWRTAAEAPVHGLIAAGRLLVTDGRAIRAYGPDGRLRWERAAGGRVDRIEVAGGYVYATETTANVGRTRVLELRTGRRVRDVAGHSVRRFLPRGA